MWTQIFSWQLENIPGRHCSRKEARQPRFVAKPLITESHCTRHWVSHPTSRWNCRALQGFFCCPRNLPDGGRVPGNGRSWDGHDHEEGREKLLSPRAQHAEARAHRVGQASHEPALQAGPRFGTGGGNSSRDMGSPRQLKSEWMPSCVYRLVDSFQGWTSGP
jgi:hypothetical protein